MTTAGSIVNRCFRENNLLPAGKTPTDTQKAEALSYLNDIINSMLGVEIGELLLDWSVPPSPTSPVPARFPLYPTDQSLPSDVYPYPPGNTRILTKLQSSQTLYLPQNPNDGARLALVNVGDGYDVWNLTIDANGRLIEGSPTRVFNTAETTPLKWFYRADLANWISIALPLAEDDDIPFPGEFDDFWVAMLAVRISPNYGKEPKSVTGAVAAAGAKKLKQRYQQETPAANFPTAAWFNSYQSFGGPGWETIP